MDILSRKDISLKIKEVEEPFKSILKKYLGPIFILLGNYEEAEKYYKESLDTARNLKDEPGIAQSLHQLGILQQDQGNYEEAEKYYKESLDTARNLKDEPGIAQSLHQLGILQQDQGNYEEAEKYYKESLTLYKELGDKAETAYLLHHMGTLYEEMKPYEKALEYYIASFETFSDINSSDAETVIEDLHSLRTTIGAEKFNHSWKTTTNQEVPDHILSSFTTWLEDLTQYIIDLAETGNQEEIAETKEYIEETIKNTEPDEIKFLQLLLDILSGKDIIQKIQDLSEPYRSTLQKQNKPQ